jgi:hypothetical protein
MNELIDNTGAKGSDPVGVMIVTLMAIWMIASGIIVFFVVTIAACAIFRIVAETRSRNRGRVQWRLTYQCC